MYGEKILLVGDNPFQGVSHLSQGRARERGEEVTAPKYGAELVRLSLENGANGFMFSINETTLSILRMLSKNGKTPKLYAIAPAAADYVRLASQLGTPGLAAYLAKQILISRNPKAITSGLQGVIRRDPVSSMKAYLFYEIYRIKSATTLAANPHCFMLHEIVTDMALALNLSWLFRSYIDFMLGLKIKPGFETRNFPYLIDKFVKWGIDLDKITLVAPFNKIGFQMSPSKIDCERALMSIPETEVVAMSILASGYLKLSEAIDYINSMPQLKGIVVGVSKGKHAYDFRTLKEALAAKG
jgi:uncharacterized protein (DUF486 family)